MPGRGWDRAPRRIAWDPTSETPNPKSGTPQSGGADGLDQELCVLQRPRLACRRRRRRHEQSHARMGERATHGGHIATPDCTPKRAHDRIDFGVRRRRLRIDQDAVAAGHMFEATRDRELFAQLLSRPQADQADV